MRRITSSSLMGALGPLGAWALEAGGVPRFLAAPTFEWGCFRLRPPCFFPAVAGAVFFATSLTPFFIAGPS
jgi:hypothetical protein